MLLTALTVMLDASIAASAAEPDFGPNVLIFDPSSKTIQSQIDAVFATQERGEFNSHRYALLFKPGKYDLDVNMGFYTQAMGLGQSPDDVAITGAIRSKATWMHGNATINFWRSAENLSVIQAQDRGADVWAVSQGTALRRVHDDGDLNLWDDGWSSGGFIADCRIEGQVVSGSQQQWFSRNSRWGAWRGGVWNMVFVGVGNPPDGTWPDKPYTVVEKTPIIAEKPYLFIDPFGHYSVVVPLVRKDSIGSSWNHVEDSLTIPIDDFYLAHADKDDANSINAALDAGKNLLLTPGIYHLQSSINVRRAGTVILGLGYPTLVPDRGTAAMVVANAEAIRIAGIIFDAGATESPTLLQVGDVGDRQTYSNPIMLYDIFCRAGGAAAGTARSFVTINANDVVGDNFWLWRADHGAGARWNTNRVANGLIVNGRDVTFYGLFVEHCQEYQTLWNGDGGRVYFYQSEMPYDPPSEAAWSHNGVNGYASYKVADTVKTHEAWGLGIYCVFTAAPIVADSAIEAPQTAGVKFHDMVTCRFGGQAGSGISHVINHSGSGIISTKAERLTEGP